MKSAQVQQNYLSKRVGKPRDGDWGLLAPELAIGQPDP